MFVDATRIRNMNINWKQNRLIKILCVHWNGSEKF